MRRIIQKIIPVLLILTMLCSAGACSSAGEKPSDAAAEVAEISMPRHDSSEDLLLLIDFQNVYLPDQPWQCPTIGQAEENTLTVLNSPYAPDYVLTMYMAPEAPVGCWVRYNEEYADINADEYLCDLTDAIKPVANGENVIVKSTYSSLDSEELQAMMNGKKRIVLTGVVAECCVLATMMDAIDLGYEAVYLYDCISGCSQENEQSIRSLAESFSPMHTQVMSSGEYLRLISAEA